MIPDGPFPWCLNHKRKRETVFDDPSYRKARQAKLVLRNTLKDRIHNGDTFALPDKLQLTEALKLVQEIAGEYIDQGDNVRGIIAMEHAKKIAGMMAE